jgi:hypothetical protein
VDDLPEDVYLNESVVIGPLVTATALSDIHEALLGTKLVTVKTLRVLSKDIEATEKVRFLSEATAKIGRL